MESPSPVVRDFSDPVWFSGVPFYSAPVRHLRHLRSSSTTGNILIPPNFWIDDLPREIVLTELLKVIKGNFTQFLVIRHFIFGFLSLLCWGFALISHHLHDLCSPWPWRKNGSILLRAEAPSFPVKAKVWGEQETLHHLSAPSSEQQLRLWLSQMH